MRLLLPIQCPRFAPFLFFVFNRGERATFAGTLTHFADGQGRAAQLLSNGQVFLVAVGSRAAMDRSALLPAKVACFRI